MHICVTNMESNRSFKGALFTTDRKDIWLKPYCVGKDEGKGFTDY